MQRLSPRMIIALHLAGYGAVFAVLGFPPRPAATVLAPLLIWISVVDALRFRIPDPAAVLLAVSGLVMLPGLPLPIQLDRVFGMILWPMIFWAVADGYRRRRGIDGLGFGDVKLMAGIGVWCGFVATINVVLAAALSGMVLLLLGALARRRTTRDLAKTPVAFGPFLCLSAWTIWLAGVSQ